MLIFIISFNLNNILYVLISCAVGLVIRNIFFTYTSGWSTSFYIYTFYIFYTWQTQNWIRNIVITIISIKMHNMNEEKSMIIYIISLSDISTQDYCGMSTLVPFSDHVLLEVLLVQYSAAWRALPRAHIWHAYTIVQCHAPYSILFNYLSSSNIS